MPKKLIITPEMHRALNAIGDISRSVRDIYSQLTEPVSWRNHEKPFIERLNKHTRKQLKNPMRVADALELIKAIDEMNDDIKFNDAEIFFSCLIGRSETLKLLCEVFIGMAAKER